MMMHGLFLFEQEIAAELHAKLLPVRNWVASSHDGLGVKASALSVFNSKSRLSQSRARRLTRAG